MKMSTVILLITRWTVAMSGLTCIMLATCAYKDRGQRIRSRLDKWSAHIREDSSTNRTETSLLNALRLASVILDHALGRKFSSHRQIGVIGCFSIAVLYLAIVVAFGIGPQHLFVPWNTIINGAGILAAYQFGFGGSLALIQAAICLTAVSYCSSKRQWADGPLLCLVYVAFPMLLAQILLGNSTSDESRSWLGVACKSILLVLAISSIALQVLLIAFQRRVLRATSLTAGIGAIATSILLSAVLALGPLFLAERVFPTHNGPQHPIQLAVYIGLAIFSIISLLGVFVALSPVVIPIVIHFHRLLLRFVGRKWNLAILKLAFVAIGLLLFELALSWIS